MSPPLDDRRVLGAVRFVDGITMATVAEGLHVQSAATLRPNRSGLWVVWRANGLERHATAFDQPPAAPALVSITITFEVTDDRNRYLARSATIKLPRDPSPASAGQPDSLFEPIAVPLYLASNAPIWPGWAVLRAHVKDNATGRPLGGALLRVLRTADKKVLARGMSDARGEALVAVPGIPITTFSSETGPALAAELDVTVRASIAPKTPIAPDPEAIEADIGLPSIALTRKLAAGRQVTDEFPITLPQNFL
ncbi:MAG: hypothetical protein ABSG46_09100 [Candidatus Binataceae bacterium]|jgi:hypothetical protein